MSPEHWLDHNNRYLSASLEWLRARLLRLVPGPPPSAPVLVTPAAEQPEPSLFQRLFQAGQEGEPAKEVRLLPEAKPDLDDQIRRATEVRASLAESDPPP